MTTPAAAAGVNPNNTQCLPDTEPCTTSRTSQTNRTNRKQKPLRIYNLTYEGFVAHLRTIYGDTAVDAMLNGVKLIDASGKPPTIPWPEPQQTSPAAATAQNNRIDFSEDLDAEDLADANNNPDDGDADPYL